MISHITAFRLTYDGPALEHHLMNPRELAPALLAMADLLDASARLLYGDKAKVDVNVKGSFKTGSFNIDFVTGLQWAQAIRDMFSGAEATAIANATAILTALGIIGNKGLLPLLKWLRGRPIIRVEPIELQPGGAVGSRIHVDQDSFDVEEKVVTLLQDVGVRKAIQHVLAPLQQPGIDVIALGNETNINVIIEASEMTYFVPPTPDEMLVINDLREMMLSIISLTFKEDNKWHFSDGTATINATVSDMAFQNAVQSNEASFSKGDLLVCQVRVKQWRTENGVRNEYEIEKVISHIRGALQIASPLQSAAAESC